MGYSNVTGDLNVQSTITSQNVYVFGSTTLNSLTTTDGTTINGTLSVPGNSSFGKITTANLTVTGNFTVTTTNTAFSNALSVNNSGTATALKVVQFEPSIHTHNVAEFWDFQTLAMVIDPSGNVGIHTTNTGLFGLSVVDGANVDSLQALTVSTGTLSTPLANVTTLNVGTLANINLLNVYSELTTTFMRVDDAFVTNLNVTTTNSLTYVTTNNVYAANALQTTNVLAVTTDTTYLVATNNVYAANAVQTTNVLTLTLEASNNLYAANALFTTNVLATTANLTTGNATYLVALNNVYAANAIQTTNVIAETVNTTTLNVVSEVATNNVFVSNSIQTTNVYASTANLTTGNATYLVALNNVYAANSIRTTNVIATTINTTTLNTVSEVATNNVYASNAIQTTNVYASTANLTTGNASTFIALNNVYAANAIQTTNLTSTGNTSISSMKVQSFNFTVASGAGSYTNVCSIADSPHGSGIYAISAEFMSRGAGGSAMTKSYMFTCNYNATTGNWTRVIPTSRPSGNNQLALDARTSGGVTTLRATNLGANEIVSAGIVLRVSSTSFSTVNITDLTTQSDVGATSTGFYPTSVYTQNNGLVGISTEGPTSNLHVVGNIYASNSIQTINVLATTSNVTTGNATYFIALNNVYAANAIQTTNVYATTSNVTTGNTTYIVALNANVSTFNASTSNTLTGNVSTFTALAANVTTFNSFTSNTLTGNVSTLTALAANVTTFNAFQSNTLTGNVSTFTSLGANVTTLNAFQSNTLTGNVSTLTALTANVTTFNAFTSNTLTGNVSSLSSLTSNIDSLNVGSSANITNMTVTNFMNVATANIGNIVISSTVSSTANSLTTNSVTFVATNNVYAANAVQTTNVLATSLYGEIVGSNTISATVVTASSNVNAPTMNATTANASTVVATTGFYGPVVGSNVIGATVITASSNVNAPTMNATTANSATVVATTGVYGPIVGSNTVASTVVTASSNVNAPTMNATTANAATVVATTGFYGPIVGSNVIGATVIIASSNVNAPTINATTSNAATVIATTGVYGPIVGSNVIGATVITASSNVNAPTINATTSNSATVVATTGVYGPIVGSNTVASTVVTASSNVNAPTMNATTANSATVVATTGFYGPVVGSNIIGASVITASSNVNAPTMNASTISNAAAFITTNNVYAANAIQTTNIVSTSLTSNSTNTNITSTLNISSLLVGGTTATTNQTLITTGSGAGVQWGTIIGSQWTTGTGNIYYISNVGIGTSAVSANLSVTGNIYASNAIQTTNIISAGFTSNATNVNFNFDTISIPYLNVSSSSTIASLILQTALATNYGGTGADGSAVTANKVLASPSGSTGGVSYRVLAAADLPTVTFSPGAAGSYGSSTAIPTIVVDTYGRITGISTSAASSLSGLTTYGVLYATSSTGATTTAVGSSGQPLLSSGAGVAPAYGTLGLSYGGTGQTTKAAAFDALSPMTTLGDIIYGGASGGNARLAGNTTATKNFLVQTGNGTVSGAPSWGTIAAGDVPTLNQNTSGSAGSLSTTFTSGYVLYGQGTGVPAFASGHYWDNSNTRLGIGTSDTSLGSTLRVRGPSASAYSNIIIETGTNATGQRSEIRFGIPAFTINQRAAISSNTYTAEASDLQFWTNPASGTAAVERMTITSAGNVGIGTTDTTSRLYVYSATASPTTSLVSIGNSIGYGAGNGDQTVLSGLYTSLGNTNNIVQQIGKSNDTNSFFYGYQHNTGSPYFWIAKYGVTNLSFTVNANGVGIGTTHTNTAFKQSVYSGDSSYTLYGPNATWGAYLGVGAGNTYCGSGRASVTCSNGNLHLDCGIGAFNMYLNYFQGGGSGGTNATVGCYAAFTATGDITAFSSDERLKTKVGLIENPLDKVCSLTAFKYIHNETARQNGFTDDNVYVGLSAQEVQKVLPEVVKPAPFDEGTEYDVGKGKSKSGENYLTIQYERIVSLLVEAVKEERKAREDLERRLKKLEVLLDRE